MLHDSSSATAAISQEREVRRQQILQALRGEADAVLERLADLLTDLPDHQVFGPIENTLRDLGHDFVAKAHQAGVDASKKRATKVPALSVPTVVRTPVASATAARPG